MPFPIRMIGQSLDFWASIASNPAVVITGVVAAVLAVILAFVAIRFAKSKRPMYLIQTNSIVRDFSSAVKSIQILKDSNPISDLSVSKITFWNAGREAIRAGDIASQDPLRITANDGVEILEHKVLNEADLGKNKFSAVPTNNSTIELKFEFLGKNEGAVLQVFHTGKKRDDVDMIGTIIDGGKLRRKNQSKFFRTNTTRKSRFPQDLSLALMSTVFFIASAIFVILYPFHEYRIIAETPVQTPFINTLAVNLFFVLPYVIFALLGFYFYFRRRLPPALAKY